MNETEVNIGKKVGNKQVVLSIEDVKPLIKLLDLDIKDQDIINEFHCKIRTNGINGAWNLYKENRHRIVALPMYILLQHSIDSHLESGITGIYTTRSTKRDNKFCYINKWEVFYPDARHLPRAFRPQAIEHDQYTDYSHYNSKVLSLIYPFYSNKDNFKKNPLTKAYFKSLDQLHDPIQVAYILRLLELGGSETFLKDTLIWHKNEKRFGIIYYIVYGTPRVDNLVRIRLQSGESTNKAKGSTWNFGPDIEIFTIAKTIKMLSEGKLILGLGEEKLFAPEVYQEAAKKLGYTIPNPYEITL